MDECVYNSCCMLSFHILKVFIEDEPLERLIPTYGEKDAGHLDVDPVITNIQGGDAADAVNARFQDVASVVTQYVITEIKRHILDILVAR